MNWISSNIDRIISLTISHTWLTLVPTIVGLLIALPLGWWAHKFKRGQAAIVGTAGLLYTIPSLALFIILPTILGTKILDPLNIVVALTLYTLALLVRVVADGLDSVPHDTVAAAEAMGYRGWQRLLLVELPVAVPVIAAGLLYTIPSLALFIILPTILGTKILDPINIVVALTLYTLALLVRVVADGLDSVPHDTVAAAEAMGYRGWQRLLLVELPVAVPAIAAGLRVAVVSNVSIVTMAALLGIPQLGSLFTQGFQLRLFVPLVTGIVLCVVLAVVFDGLIIWLNKLLTPWRQRTVTS